ncbi:hypothetical protein RUM44_012777 [Polyplax serrata]|uniref:Uncharacterized protein n=1 Tax=Polyplax serrata TaxID=468196 RepID=A0ABR1BH52_POLSC
MRSNILPRLINVGIGEVKLAECFCSFERKLFSTIDLKFNNINGTLAVTMKQFGGRPIECVIDKELNAEVVNNFCWVHSTFSSWKLLVNDNETQTNSAEEFYGKREPIFMMENDRFKLFRRGQVQKAAATMAASAASAKDGENGKEMAKYSHGIWHSAGAYPGVETVTTDSFLRYHKYVQWVGGILIIQNLPAMQPDSYPTAVGV